MKSLEEYRELLEDRPVKFTAEDVDYRDADTIGVCCERCIHFYERSRDLLGVCEIFRSQETDEDGVDPNYVC